MAALDLLQLVPGAPAAVGAMLDARRGPLEPPNRSEIFGPERFAQHGRSLGETHAARFAPSGSAAFFPRLLDNIRILREAHRYIGWQATSGYDVSPAAEWLLDNFHLIEAQMREIKDGLPRGYFRDLPVLQHDPLVGLPRVYGVAWAFVAHTDSAFNEELLVHFLQAYQQSRELTLGELWALPTTLRVVLIENLRRLAERVAANKAAREVANLCSDRLDEYGPARLDQVLALLNRRGVGETFLALLAQRVLELRWRAASPAVEGRRGVAPHLGESQKPVPAAQAADNLSVGNAIKSLRSIGDADWPEIVAQTSVLTQLMLTSPAFAAERVDTRDQTLHAIEKLAKKSGRSERSVAETLLGLMHRSSDGASRGDGDDDSASVANYWLRGLGQAELLQALDIHDRSARRRLRLLRRAALPSYLGAIAIATASVVAWVLFKHGVGQPASESLPWLTALAAVLLVFPASEAVVAVINRIISESVRPSRLPRLALAAGIPPELRTMVVVPAMLTGPESGRELAHQLQLHYLANPEPGVQFAMLTDWADATSQQMPEDEALLQAARREIERLNASYPSQDEQAPRFIVLHRERRFATSEQRWIGWERKRGKLEQLLGMLAEETASPFIDLGAASRVAVGVRYVLTLDSDTRLPPGRLRDLVGVAGHPHNQPRLAADGRRVERGYGILQPHVATPLPPAEDVTLYHWLFSGQSGIDPYSAASSEVFQDVFGEGTFTGKGLLHVQAVHAVLGQRLPEGQILSHDLLEGSLARCAAVTDVNVIEDAPFHADVAASRVHRWTRGDWQLLPALLRARRYGIRAINCWKMIDNLRRSLVAPLSLALLALSLATGVVPPWAALGLIGLAFTAGPLLGAIAAFAPSRDEIARSHFYRQVFADIARAALSGAWLLAQLMQLALMAVDAIVRAVHRTFVSRRHLLEWTTAASAQASATTRLAVLARKHWRVALASVLLWLLLLAAKTPYPALAGALCATWALSPVWTWWVSRRRPPRLGDALSTADEAYLHGVARDTWRLFERTVVAGENALPPDNLQTAPHDMVAHRTSPTNIGLYLFASACAREFGWIGRVEMIERIEATLATLATLPRHRGHFLNWYETASAKALTPLYVSTVDSGNLCCHLLAVAQACLELAGAPRDDAALGRGLARSRVRIAALRAASEKAIGAGAVEAALGLADPLAEIARDPDRLTRELAAASAELAAWLPTLEAEAPPRPSHLLGWAIEDHLATLASALRDAGRSEDFADRLQAIAATCQLLAREPDFEFLFHRKRRLFHIGFRVAEHQHDAGFYDLLASEARATSLWAIAKGDIAATHWSALGRPFFAVSALAALRSWSGSMFEYLMPTLVLDEPHGSVLHSAALAAVEEQIAYAREHHVPWGISESAYAASDHTLAYQYAPQGVPKLALRRTPADELVVAPYATSLAAQIAPHRAVINLRRFEQALGRGRYGFIEAFDYTPSRQSGSVGVTRVHTFMAHHQAMTIVALGNVLLDRAPRRWGMGDPRIEAVSSLLHERAPREVSVLHDAPSRPAPDGLQKRLPGMLRDVLPGMAAIEPTHLLSNGRYAVALRANGAGTSRWGANMVTRTRDDALRDSHGTFFHLRWDRQPRAVSLTQHPAPDRAAHYQSSFHADRVSFSAAWSELDAVTTVWVSPEDDIEFRQIVLRNLGDRMLDLELMSAFEVTLADQRADESHPAFSNLFVTAEWQPEYQALVFERKPRLAMDKAMLAAHFIAGADVAIAALRVQVDRQRWLGRSRGASRPLASFDEPPQPGAGGGGVALDTGLDPVAAFSLRLQIPERGEATLTFCTAAADNAATLRAVIDKYRQASNVERASLMSATLTGIRLREMRLNADNFAALQTLTTLLALTLTRTHSKPRDAADVCDRRLLWRFGISGDHPIVLVSAGVAQGFSLLRSLVQALRLWSWGGIACDLVIVNHEPTSYVMALNRQLLALKDAHIAAGNANPGAAEAGLHLLQSSDLQPDETATLRALARVRLNADGRPLAHHVQELVEVHDGVLEELQGVSSATLPADMGAEIAPRAPVGDFAALRGEFRFDVTSLTRPARPWINVLANPDFGAQLSEAGGGYSWALNSKLNMLTPWSNDPVADPTGEWFLLQDTRTMQAWSVSPSAGGDSQVEYRVSHGQGYSIISHRRGALDVNVSWCVDPVASVKQVRLRLVNRGHRTLQLRVIGLVEWILGANRGDRGTTSTTAAHVPAAPAEATPAQRDEAGGAQAEGELRMTALFCSQRDRSAGFGGGTAFFGLAGDAEDLSDWTCDRRESFDARGRIIVPDQYGQTSGCGLDPCAAVATRLSLRAGESVDRVFLLGWAPSPEGARALAERAALVPALERLQRVRGHWDELLGGAVVRTPDPLFDAMVNRWLLYQTIACRLWAKAGFYQAGGAYGYRDQLQDAMALAASAPEMLRRQIVLCASRQFREGDVQHWWHAPTGTGVRTHFSDDLLWLPHAVLHYTEVTGDATVLDEAAPFLEGAGIAAGAEDAYYAPTVSDETASVYEHCARAIDRSLKVGVHGLPLMGTGDWNDGMNRVGHEGRGESVWLAWFLCDLVARFAPVAERRGDTGRGARWTDAARGWHAALEDEGWDGQWYRRAFFDDGSPLGASANEECRIDLVAQAWAVLSHAAPEARARAAMAALDARLVDRAAGLVKLLDPPLSLAQPSAGYIQAYPPGVRENGGQYSHAAIWALMAQAECGNADAAWRYFTYLSPAHRSRDPARAAAYAIEPYVIAGDVYSAPPWVGRGGWSWYTGSAAWLHRAAIESIFGVRQRGDEVWFSPCLPPAWRDAEIVLSRGGSKLRVLFVGASAAVPAEQAAAYSAVLLQPGERIRWSTLAPGACYLMPFGTPPVAERALLSTLAEPG